jgi:ketosteroid isomerase-like protein
MPEQENVDLIRRLYEAFGKRDINTIIDHLASQFVWRFDAPSTVPYAGDFKTPDEVRRGFFGSLAETQKDQALKPEEFIAHDDKVVMIGQRGGHRHQQAIRCATGARFYYPKRKGNTISEFHRFGHGRRGV